MRTNPIPLFMTIVFLFAAPSFAEEEREDPKESSPRLPFQISEKKRLLDRDIATKQEGWYMTGLPLVNSDPVTGFGYGARAYLYNNATRQDPFFNYTPYRTRIFAQYFNTTKNWQYHWVSLDAPFIFDTKWRLRTDLIYDSNPNNLYFGIGENSLRPLSYQKYNDPNMPRMANATWSDYIQNLSYARKGQPGDPVYLGNKLFQAPSGAPGFYETNQQYNRYKLEIPQVSASMERSYLGGTARLVFGGRMAKNILTTFDGKYYQSQVPVIGTTDNAIYPVSTPLYIQNLAVANGYDPSINTKVNVPNGPTKVTQDAQAGKILGIQGGFINTIRAGIVYDTRDLEPDPNRGVFLEATAEKSTRAIGSDYDYYKLFTQARVYYSPLPDLLKKVPKRFEKFVLAGRVAYGETQGKAPFFEYRNLWSTEGTITGLGGLRTLRGYKQDRFVGPAMGWANLEIRWKFTEFKIGSQTFALNLVPFVDLGRVWDSPSRVNLTNYKYNRGLGLRIAWNQATIIMIDYAKSEEDSQLFVNFNHIF